MKSGLEQRVLDAIRRSGMLTPGDRVAVGVSGGADSVALLRLLEGMREELGITLILAHFDHALRGKESDADAEFVAELARRHGLDYVSERADAAAAAAEQRLNLEDAARRLRYGFFQSIVDAGRATRVAVAHTADDQAETVLARLLRGTGPAGLAGIYPIRGPVVRPLLTIRREEVREYLRGLGQPWREDLSNLDLHRQRARIRAQLLPVLEKDFSRQIVSHLAQLAELSREEQQFWNTLVEDRMQRLVREAEGRATIQICDLLSPLGSHGDEAQRASLGAVASLPLTQRMIRRLYEKVRGSRHDLAATHVEQVIRLASELGSGSKIELPGRVIAERDFGSLTFSLAGRRGGRGNARETEYAPRAYQYAVDLPPRGETTISVPELGTCFLLKVIDWCSAERDTIREDTLDAELLRSTLTLRNWQPGDAYRPRGHRQARKLKQLFVARRVPRKQRARWPVIECGGRIIWARNMPPAGDFSAGERTERVLLIQESAGGQAASTAREKI